jgi:CRP-like cAMP-binding protein
MPQRAFLGNRLLDALSDSAFASVQNELSLLRLERETVVYHAQKPIEQVYFPIDCVLAAVTLMRNGDACATSTVGREGVCGSQLLFASERADSATLCQVSGSALVMNAANFIARCKGTPEFQKLVLTFTDGLFARLNQSIACNRLHRLTLRCACRLLTTQDQTGRSEFFLTHESLARMLGTARPAVSIAAGELAAGGAIRYKRGHVIITDHAKLLSASCECYTEPLDDYSRNSLN